MREKKRESYSLNLRRSSQLKEKFFYKEGNYVVKWDNAYLHADAICFKFDELGKKRAH
jgi:hypothetical protein